MWLGGVCGGVCGDTPTMSRDTEYSRVMAINQMAAARHVVTRSPYGGTLSRSVSPLRTACQAAAWLSVRRLALLVFSVHDHHTCTTVYRYVSASATIPTKRALWLSTGGAAALPHYCH